LQSLATLQRDTGPVKIDREMGGRYSVVIANVSGRDLVGFVEDAKARVNDAVKLPTGYRISWGGQFENQQRAAARLALVVPLAPHSHGTAQGRLSPEDQVMGRSRAMQVQVLLDKEELERLREVLQTEFAGTRLRYWATPVVLEGEFA
jgi:hypothetical protein